MRGDSDDDDEDAVADAGGGFAARRAKAKRQAEKLEARDAWRRCLMVAIPTTTTKARAGDGERPKGGDDLTRALDPSIPTRAASEEGEASDEDSDEDEGSTRTRPRR